MPFRRLVLAIAVAATAPAAGPLEEGFRRPPVTARPQGYYMVLERACRRAHVETELKNFEEAGIGGICIFDIGAPSPGCSPPDPCS